MAIIGNEHVGKTIFVSLMYAAQIRYSDETAGDFRFNSEPNVLKILGYQYNSLRRGEWPKKKLWGDISFSFGYGLKSFSSKMKRIFNKNYEAPKISLNFGLYELSTPKPGATTQETSKHLITEPKRLDSLVRSKIIIALLDSSKLGRDDKTDQVISKVISKISQTQQGQIYPIIVYTKYDIVAEKKLKKLKLHAEPPDVWQAEARKEYGTKLTKKYYPKLYEIITAKKPEYYFVYLNVEKDSKGKKVPSLSPDPDIEIDHSHYEYKNLIKQLGVIGKH